MACGDDSTGTCISRGEGKKKKKKKKKAPAARHQCTFPKHACERLHTRGKELILPEKKTSV
jgi:hypothetical protein